jgi:hypothetical protein
MGAVGPKPTTEDVARLVLAYAPDYAFRLYNVEALRHPPKQA